MDGLIVLALIIWAIARKNKKKKNSQTVNAERKTVRANEPQHREDRLKNLRAELERRKAELQMRPEPVQAAQTVTGEGESLFRNTSFEQTDTLEGECICDPALEHERETLIEADSVYANEIGKEPLIDFSARGLLQGVVMSEILTRPAQRAHRR